MYKNVNIFEQSKSKKPHLVNESLIENRNAKLPEHQKQTVKQENGPPIELKESACHLFIG